MTVVDVTLPTQDPPCQRLSVGQARRCVSAVSLKPLGQDTIGMREALRDDSQGIIAQQSGPADRTARICSRTKQRSNHPSPNVDRSTPTRIGPERMQVLDHVHPRTQPCQAENDVVTRPALFERLQAGEETVSRAKLTPRGHGSRGKLGLGWLG